MKRSILTLTIAASLISMAPALQARDHWDEDFHADSHSLWDWYGHLRDESKSHGDRRTHDELEGIRSSLENVDRELHDGHYHSDRVRGELDGIRDNLHHVSDELHWHGDIKHRPGFVIEFR